MPVHKKLKKGLGNLITGTLGSPIPEDVLKEASEREKKELKPGMADLFSLLLFGATAGTALSGGAALPLAAIASKLFKSRAEGRERLTGSIKERVVDRRENLQSLGSEQRGRVHDIDLSQQEAQRRREEIAGGQNFQKEEAEKERIFQILQEETKRGEEKASKRIQQENTLATIKEQAKQTIRIAQINLNAKEPLKAFEIISGLISKVLALQQSGVFAKSDPDLAAHLKDLLELQAEARSKLQSFKSVPKTAEDSEPLTITGMEIVK